MIIILKVARDVFLERKRQLFEEHGQERSKRTHEGYLTMEKREDRLAVIRGQC